MRSLVIPLVLILSTPAFAETPCKRLRDAITVFDVNASIADSDVALWNAVIASARHACPSAPRFRRRK